MSIKIGINGFGRIGRMVFRACLEHPEIDVVGINDLCPADYLAYMLKYDTMHGRCKADIESRENALVVNGQVIPVFSERDPANLKWGKLGAGVYRRVHRPVPDEGKGCRPHRRRRKEGRHVRAEQGRHPDVRHGREP